MKIFAKYGIISKTQGEEKADRERCKVIEAELKQHSANWARAEQGLRQFQQVDQSRYIPNPVKTEGSFRDQAMSNFKNEFLGIGSAVTGLIPGGEWGSAILGIIDTSAKAGSGQVTEATISGTLTTAGAIGVKRASWAGLTYSVYSILWGPYTDSIQRRQAPAYIRNPTSSHLYAQIDRSKAAITSWSALAKEHNCARFHQ